MLGKLITRRETGKQAERIAEKYLHKHKLKTLARNYSCRSGEIDLIMLDEQLCIVFVEVRFRKNIQHGSGAESVTRFKQTRIIKTAQFYLQQNSCYASNPARFDVISISNQENNLSIDWIKNAFC